MHCALYDAGRCRSCQWLELPVSQQLADKMADLRALQISAGRTLGTGLGAAQEARSALSKAISERATLPRRFTEDPEVLRGLLESADTLDAFAAGLALNDVESAGIEDFGFGHGKLPLPVQGTLLRRPDEADGAGVRRPGMVLATRKQALVTAPWAGTIRYRGPLLDQGNVMVLANSWAVLSRA